MIHVSDILFTCGECGENIDGSVWDGQHKPWCKPVGALPKRKKKVRKEFELVVERGVCHANVLLRRKLRFKRSCP
jgi:hypothetical protein